MWKAGLFFSFLAGAQVALVDAHMSIWHKSMYGVGEDFAYDVGDPVAPIGPDLQNQDDWWFRGPSWRAKKPQDGAVMDLPAGGKVDIEIACHVAWTSLGARTTNLSDDLAACPDNYGAYHSGDPAGPIDDTLLSGCALGIADVDNIEDVTMDNLAIFSVNHRCVRDRVTSFEIPEKMPACTGKNCICAWFWLANNGTTNFYMTGFDCAVIGSPADATAIAPPQDPVYCGDDPSSCTVGSKRPLYAYNKPSNVPWFDNDHRPGYHASWSFPNDGAQNDIFELSGTGGEEVEKGQTSTLSSSSIRTDAAAATSSAARNQSSSAGSSTLASPTSTSSPPSPTFSSSLPPDARIAAPGTGARTSSPETSSTLPISAPSSPASSSDSIITSRPWRSHHPDNNQSSRLYRPSGPSSLAAAAPSSSSSVVDSTETGTARIANDVADVVESLRLSARARLVKRIVRRKR